MSYIIKGKHDPKAIPAAIEELENGSDRSAAVIGGSFVESALKLALITALHKDAKTTDEMFRATGALGAFASKIRLGKLIGLYGAEACKELENVKDIRNAFAHKLDVVDFSNDRMKSLANNLKLCESWVAGTFSVKYLWPKNIKSRNIYIDAENWQPSPKHQNMLSTPKGRYILTVQVFLNGFGHVFKSRMPEPMF